MCIYTAVDSFEIGHIQRNGCIMHFNRLLHVCMQIFGTYVSWYAVCKYLTQMLLLAGSELWPSFGSTSFTCLSKHKHMVSEVYHIHDRKRHDITVFTATGTNFLDSANLINDCILHVYFFTSLWPGNSVKSSSLCSPDVVFNNHKENNVFKQYLHT